MATKTAAKETDLSASALKGVLWDTLNEIRAGTIQPGTGDAIASQAREILRTVKVQLQVANQAKRDIAADVIAFAEK